MEGWIYVITCDVFPLIKMIYIGQTTLTLDERMDWHRASAKNGDTSPLHKYMRRYGESHFHIKPLLPFKVSLLDFWEKYFIEEYNTIFPNGFNAKAGGAGRSLPDNTESTYLYTYICKLHDENRMLKKENETLKRRK